MRKKQLYAGVLVFWILGTGWSPAFAGDSLYGRVTAVKSADSVTFDYGDGQYDLRLVGIDVPKDGALAEKAVGLVSKMVLGKNARMRFEGRGQEGDMRARLFTDDPVLGIQEVGVELVRGGLARRQEGYDFKYGELATAEREAQNARRGLWAAQPR
jgi:endonuclease YncB( thermonuclease family)